MANAIILNVLSVNNSNLTAAVPTVFEISKLGSIRANQNTKTAYTITPASALGTGAWSLYFAPQLQVPTKLYFTISSETISEVDYNTVKVYSNSGLTSLVAQGTAADTAAITLVEKNESGIAGKIAATTFSAAGNSTLTIANFATSKNLGLNGESEFVYSEYDGKVLKYTVDETVAEIEALINPAS